MLNEKELNNLVQILKGSETKVTDLKIKMHHAVITGSFPTKEELKTIKELLN